jgi:hypothetical protein
MSAYRIEHQPDNWKHLLALLIVLGALARKDLARREFQT